VRLGNGGYKWGNMGDGSGLPAVINSRPKGWGGQMVIRERP
jgi:hypothetical protein